jgi:hypothetical protein
VLLPSYTLLHDAKFSSVLPELFTSALDRLTIADSLQNPEIVMLALCMTFLYVAFAYFTLFYSFTKKMTEFEFPPQQQYLDSFIQQHSLMIRGVNQSIGADEANLLIRKLFEEKFGHKQVISVNTVRRTENVQELFLKRQVYRKRVE